VNKKEKKVIILTLILAIITLCSVIITSTVKTTNKLSKITDPETLRALSYGQITDNDTYVEGCKNLEFSAFFTRDLDGDGNAEKMKGTSKYINGSDKLYIDLNVLAGGRLENGVITINGNNFNYSLNMVKDSVLKYSYISNNVRTISLNNLESGTQKLIYGDILANIGSDTNNYTRTDNTVTLKGVYVAEDGTKTNVNKTINIAVDWYGTTNTSIEKQYFSFNYANLKDNDLKFDLKTNELANQLLLKETGVTLTVPKLGNYAPEKVECTSANVETNYNNEKQELTIKRASECDENGIVTNMISRSNTYSISIKYPNEAYDEIPVGSEINIPINAYYEGYNNKNKEFNNPYKSTASTNISLILKQYPTGDMYNIYVDYLGKRTINKPYKRTVVSKQEIIDAYNAEQNENKEYTVRWMAVRGAEGKVKSIKISEQKSLGKYGDRWGYDVMEEYVSNTGIYFSGASGMLGTNGTIKVYDDTTNELLETFTSKNWGKYTSTNPYKFAVPVKHIRVETSEASTNSNLYVNCIKEIDMKKLMSNYTLEKIKSINYIYTYVTGKFNVDGDNEHEVRNSDSAEWVSNKSYATVSMKKSETTTDETMQNQEIYIKAEATETYDSKWKNGQFIVEIPNGIINMKLNSVTSNNTNVEVSGYSLYQKNGNYYVKIITKNEQAQTFGITINCDMVPDPRLPSKTQQVKLYYYNELANDYYYTSRDYYDVNGNGITSDNVGYANTNFKFLAATGLITFETVTDYNKAGDTTIAPNIAEIEKSQNSAKINMVFTNNYSSSVKNVQILGKIPFEGNKYTINQNDMNSKFTTTMTNEGIELPNELKQNAKIYYSEQENPNKDITNSENGWILSENITDFSNIKSYLIDMNSYTMNIGKSYTISYKINVPNGLNYNMTTFASHAIYYELATEGGNLKLYAEPAKVGIKVARKYNLDVTKYKENTTHPVQGSTYKLTEENEYNDANTNLLTTDANGKMVLEGLYVDSVFTFKEINESKDYKLNEDEIKFKVIENNNGELELKILSEDNFAQTATMEKDENSIYTLKGIVQDEPRYEVIVNYKDSETHNPISGIISRIGENGYTGKTDENGTVTLPRLLQNTEYTLEQRKADGYYLNENIKFKLIKAENNTFKIESENENFVNAQIQNNDDDDQIKIYVNLTNAKIPTYKLKIVKQQEKSDKKLQGAKYKLTEKDTNETQIYETNENGEITLENLHQYIEGKTAITGEYVLQEVSAPSGYMLNSEEIKFKASKNEEDKITLSIQQKEALQTLVSTSTDESDANTAIITLKNKPLFKLVKKDSETGEVLVNAKFEIYELDADGKELDHAKDANGNYVAENTNYIVTTDESGEITLPLRPGKYKAIEVGFPENYQEKETIEYFEVEDTNKEETKDDGDSEDEEVPTYEYDENYTLDEVVEVNYIEDLLQTFKVSDTNKYQNIVVKLQRNLDFNDDNSYKNASDTQYGDLNGNGTVETIKEELTNKEGKGMPKIVFESFGEFDGQGFEIRNLYINSSESEVSLFSIRNITYFGNLLIKSLGITGKINAQNANAVAVFSTMNADIVNCYNKVNINVKNEEKDNTVYVGSFLAVNTGKSVINSYNEGNINISAYNDKAYMIGGIIGYNYSSVYIKNVYNKGNIILKNGKGNIGGLIGYQRLNKGNIKNAYNTGNIITDKELETNVGSICGYSDTEISENLKNVYELDGITIEGKVIYNRAEKKGKEYMLSENFKNDLGENWKIRENDYPIIDNSKMGIQINYIEDLIELSSNTNSSMDQYSKFYRVPIYINRTLDFEEDESYKNFNDISYGDLNGNGTVETIKEELTNKEGKGFTPINKINTYFSPIIYGQNNEIKNLYMNNSDGNYLAFIGCMTCGKIKDLTVSGNIIATKKYTSIGGIVGGVNDSGYDGLEIENCHNKVNIKSTAESSCIGGICGKGPVIIIKDCSNNGNINAINCESVSVGGIISSSSSLYNSKNKRYIYNCYNNGNINIENR
jgi:hypothetical protein